MPNPKTNPRHFRSFQKAYQASTVNDGPGCGAGFSFGDHAMIYFKHKVNAHRNENLAVIIDEFGLEGYGLYWIIVEIIAEQMRGDKIKKTWVEYPYVVWRQLTGVSKRKIRIFAEFLGNFENFPEKIEIFKIKASETALMIDCPKILKIKDEYSQKRERNEAKISG